MLTFFGQIFASMALGISSFFAGLPAFPVQPIATSTSATLSPAPVLNPTITATAPAIKKSTASEKAIVAVPTPVSPASVPIVNETQYTPPAPQPVVSPVATKTGYQVCGESFPNETWDGTYGNNGNYNCVCQSGYVWNQNSQSCQQQTALSAQKAQAIANLQSEIQAYQADMQSDKDAISDMNAKAAAYLSQGNCSHMSLGFSEGNAQVVALEQAQICDSNAEAANIETQGEAPVVQQINYYQQEIAYLQQQLYLLENTQ